MSMPPASFPKRKPCYDWIFSSASNVHIAIDRSAFKTYIPFRTYVLAVADQRQVPARGIGSVELRLKRQPGSKESHKIILANVLHVPTWLCNIISDTHLSPAKEYEHDWSEFGVSFKQFKDDKWKHWGYTEGFCGLERLVLAKDLCGRSPMLEDKDREVFSVNVSWPQHQRDKWTLMVEEEERRVVKEQEVKAAKVEQKRKSAEQKKSEAKAKMALKDAKDKGAVTADTDTEAADNHSSHRPDSPALSSPVKHATRALMEADPNVSGKMALRSYSLRVPGKSALREALPWRKSVDV